MVSRIDNKPDYNIKWTNTVIESIFQNKPSNLSSPHPLYYQKGDIIKKLNSYPLDMKFDLVIMTRVLEHLSVDYITSLLFMLNEKTYNKSILAFTYPNFSEIANQLLQLDATSMQYKMYNIELFNELSNYDSALEDAHKTYLTPSKVMQLANLEHYFEVIHTTPLFSIGNNRRVYNCSFLAKGFSDEEKERIKNVFQQ
jgi:hypothetical protein